MRVERWSTAEARTAIASPDLDRQLGAAVGLPAVIVDDPGPDDHDLATRLASLPVVVIAAAVSRGLATGSDPDATEIGPWDVVTTEVEAVVEGVLAAPLAAVTAAQILRGHSRRSVAEGLLVESWAYASLQNGPEFGRWLEGRGRRVRRPDAEPRVRIDDHGDRADLWLTRPRLRNLLDAAMRDQLVDALETLGARPDVAVTLRGEGPAFCAGGDPAEFGTVSDPATAHAIRSTANVAPWLHAVAERTTAVVHGPCVGAGVELAAVAADIRARPDARFRLPETRMGLIPGAGGTVSIPRRIGRSRTLEWLLRDDEIDAPTALAWGLVDAIEPE